MLSAGRVNSPAPGMRTQEHDRLTEYGRGLLQTLDAADRQGRIKAASPLFLDLFLTWKANLL